MPPSGFSPGTAAFLGAFIEGCHQELQKEVLDGKHADLDTARRHEINQIKKALSGAEPGFKRAVLGLVLVTYELNLSNREAKEITERMHITPEGILVEG